LVLFWAAPFIFASAVEWSRRNYQLVLAVVFGFRYLRLTDNILDVYGSTAVAAVAALHLSLFTSAFLRLPFRVAFCLSIGGYLISSAACVWHFHALQSTSFVIPVGIAVGLGLFASWRLERRERRLFDFRERAESVAREANELRRQAERAAEDAQVQTRKAEDARNESLAAVARQKILLDELDKAHKLRGFMIRAFHHDAKHPLLVIAPAVREIEAMAFSNDAFVAFRSKSDVILSQVSEFEKLVDGLKSLVDVGDFVPKCEPVSVNGILAFVADAYAEAANDKKIELLVRTREQDVFLWTDANAARRMLMNLVSNAIKYTLRGRVLVKCVKLRNELRIDIRDSGIGIPAEKKDDIYREFFRLEHPEMKEVGGQGLGLAIVRHFRDKMPGHRVEHNSAIGRGTRFSLTFQLAPTMPAKTGTQPAAQLAVPLDKVYVILVEDHEKVRVTLKTFLHSEGYDVRENVKDFATASELREYFKGARHRAPTVVISDYGLLDGETAQDVAKIVDECFDWEKVPVIVYTAETMSSLPFERPSTYLLTKASDFTPLGDLLKRAVLESRREEVAG